MLHPGNWAPDFELPGAAAGSIEVHSLSEYTSRGWTVVLTFYPFDFHPECARQCYAFSDSEELTLLDDVVVLGVGTDSAYSHLEFADEFNLQFPLLSDSDGSVSESYGILMDVFEGHRRVPRRAVFVIAPHGREILYAWSATDPSDLPDMEAIEAAASGPQAPRGDV
jgi:peroxiredoxin